MGLSISSALSRYLLRCPPLRSAVFFVDDALSISAVRHVGTACVSYTSSCEQES